MEEDWKQRKIEAIERCLRGGNDDVGLTSSHYVNLWQLRELALSPGGLVCADLRRRAWPLLAQVLRSTASSSVTVPLSGEALRRIQRDVRFSRWKVEEDAHSSQPKRKPFSPLPPKTPRRVQFAVDCIVGTMEESELNIDSKGTKESTPENASSSSSRSNANPFEESYMKPSPASAAEQRMVANVITSVLQRMPPEGEQCYSYYTGFHDLTTLILMNVQSLSLTSLLLGQLAVYHLRDALSGTLDETLQSIAPALLQRVDPSWGMTDHRLVSFLRPVVASWFASSSSLGGAIASRYLDVFFVSHAAMPLYCAVASLVSPPASDVEDVIALALQYMERYPPSVKSSPPSWRCTLPSWCTVGTSPTEWTMHLSQENAPPHPSNVHSAERYPLSRIALGLPTAASIHGRRLKRTVLAFAILLMSLNAMALWFPESSFFFQWADLQSRRVGDEIGAPSSPVDAPLSHSCCLDLQNRLPYNSNDEPTVVTSVVPSVLNATEREPTSLKGLFSNVLPMLSDEIVNEVPKDGAAAVDSSPRMGNDTVWIVARNELVVVEPLVRHARRRQWRFLRRRLRTWVSMGTRYFVSALEQSSPFWYIRRHS